MEFLKMAQEVRKRVGLQGSGPSSVSATGQEGLVISLVQDSWRDLQTLRKHWKWMRDTKTFLLSANVTTYLPATIFGPTNRFKRWYESPMYITVNSLKSPLQYISYNQFIYLHNNDVDSGIPSSYTIRPQDNALIFPKPNDMYTITADYHKSVQELTLAPDVPEMPSDYHMAIVYDAIYRYSATLNIPHVYQLYAAQHSKLMGDLLRDQNPQLPFNVRGIA